MNHIPDNFNQYRLQPEIGETLIQQKDLTGYDNERNAYNSENDQSEYCKQLPPLYISYTSFAQEKSRFELVSGSDLPTRTFGAHDMDLVDLHGSGLPDMLEINRVVRYWRNLS